MTWRETLTECFYHGPPDRSGLVLLTLGMLLWWRMLAMCLWLTASMLSILVLHWFLGPGATILGAYLIGTVTERRMMHLSPKYTITKNY